MGAYLVYLDDRPISVIHSLTSDWIQTPQHPVSLYGQGCILILFNHIDPMTAFHLGGSEVVRNGDVIIRNSLLTWPFPPQHLSSAINSCWASRSLHCQLYSEVLILASVEKNNNNVPHLPWAFSPGVLL